MRIIKKIVLFAVVILFFFGVVNVIGFYDHEELTNRANSSDNSMTALDQEERALEKESLTGENEEHDEGTETKSSEREPVFSDLVLLAAGDVMVHQTQYRQAFVPEEGRYDFSPSFEFVAPYISSADLAVANLETTLARDYRQYSAYPLFNSPDEIAFDLAEAGFDLLCTANNHSLDSGEKGLYRTIEVIEEAGMIPFGTARLKEERDEPLLVEVNEVKLAFLAYTYGTNMLTVPDGKEYIVNLIELELMEKDINKAKKRGADLVILYLHWGVEYTSEPNEEQLELAEDLAKAGADIILGSHPHVIQPLEYIEVEKENGKKHRALVAYSMGNFVSNQHKVSSIPTDDVEYGLMLRLHLRKNLHNSETFINEVDYILTWVHRQWRHRIIPLHEILAGKPEDYNISTAKKKDLAAQEEVMRKRLEGSVMLTPGL